MNLRQKQVKFASMVASLISKAFELGYEVTLGDCYRDPRVHGEVGVKMGYGHPRSCHKLRLAIDLNLFKDGVFIQDEKGHKELGEWWELQGGSWGGRFQDYNHYSLSWEGMR